MARKMARANCKMPEPFHVKVAHNKEKRILFRDRITKMDTKCGDAPKSKQLIQTSLRRYVTCHTKNRVGVETAKDNITSTFTNTTTATTPKSRFRGLGIYRSNSSVLTEKFSCYEDVCESPLSRRKNSGWMSAHARRSSSSAFALQERDPNMLASNDGDSMGEARRMRFLKRPADLYLLNKFSSAVAMNAETAEPASPFDSKRRKTALFFDHDLFKDIPLVARSLQRVHSLSTLEKAPNSPDYIAVNLSQYLSGIRYLASHYSLKTVERPHCDSHSAFGCISGDTLRELLFSFTAERFANKFFLVDCRYPYEFNGGHIRNAVNIFDVSDVSRVFYPQDPMDFRDMNSKIPIFYCEFSQQRGPQMAMELRKLDRERNLHNYPHVDYKEIYVVDQGYRKFFRDDEHCEYCEPNGYVPMIHANHVDELKKFRFHYEKRRVKRAPHRHASRLQDVMDEEAADDLSY